MEGIAGLIFSVTIPLMDQGRAVDATRNTVAVVVLCVLVSVVSFGTMPLRAAGGGEAIYSLAKVLLNFTHVPSVSQKATLQGILDDDTTTVPEQVLARALLNVEHVASPDDKPKLEAIIRNESAPPAVKTVATILNDLIHTPTEVDKKKLRQLCSTPVEGSQLRVLLSSNSRYCSSVPRELFPASLTRAADERIFMRFLWRSVATLHVATGAHGAASSCSPRGSSEKPCHRDG